LDPHHLNQGEINMAIIAYRAVTSDGSLHAEVFESEKAKRFSGPFCPVGRHTSTTVKEDLYLTDKGVWVKNTVTLNSRRGSETGDVSVYTSISRSEARDWLKAHDYMGAAEQHFTQV
jgi:hypothetical protein